MAERKKKRKKNVSEIGNGLLPIEHEAGRWAGRWASVGAGWRAGLWVLGAGARGRRADWRAGRDGAGLGAQARARAAGERQRRWGTQAAEARRHWGAQASGTAWAPSVGDSDARGCAAGSGRARGAAGWAACARLVCAAGPGWVFRCTLLSFWPSLTRYFPESLNEHCSSQFFSKKKNLLK